MLTATDYWISWSIIGALTGVLSQLSQRGASDALLTRVFDGLLGACVGGELVRRWDASQAAAAPGLLAATVGSVLFLYILGRLRPA